MSLYCLSMYIHIHASAAFEFSPLPLTRPFSATVDFAAMPAPEEWEEKARAAQRAEATPGRERGAESSTEPSGLPAYGTLEWHDLVGPDMYPGLGTAERAVALTEAIKQGTLPDFPREVKEWAAEQDVWFPNLPPCPSGWIRARSRKSGHTYYVRMEGP